MDLDRLEATEKYRRLTNEIRNKRGVGVEQWHAAVQ